MKGVPIYWKNKKLSQYEYKHDTAVENTQECF